VGILTEEMRRRRRRRKKKLRAKNRMAATTPPTAMPAMAPAERLELGDGVGVLEATKTVVVGTGVVEEV
jgi:hypothetical protein